MARLTTARRNALPKSDFAVPSKDGYPVDTPGRARNALSRVSQFGSPQEKAQVRRKVARDYPGIEQTEGPQAKKPKVNGNGRNGNGNGAARNGNGNGAARNGNGNGAARNGNGAARNGGGTTQRLARELGRRLDERMAPRR